MIQKCEKCGKKLPYKKYRKVNLCDSCYMEKRSEDIKMNMRVMRTGSTELPEKQITLVERNVKELYRQQRLDLQYGLREMRKRGYVIKGYEVGDPNDLKSLGGWVEIKGKKEFETLPYFGTIKWVSAYNAEKDITKLAWYFEPYTETEYAEYCLSQDRMDEKAKPFKKAQLQDRELGLSLACDGFRRWVTGTILQGSYDTKTGKYLTPYDFIRDRIKPYKP